MTSQALPLGAGRFRCSISVKLAHICHIDRTLTLGSPPRTFSLGMFTSHRQGLPNGVGGSHIPVVKVRQSAGASLPRVGTHEPPSPKIHVDHNQPYCVLYLSIFVASIQPPSKIPAGFRALFERTEVFVCAVKRTTGTAQCRTSSPHIKSQLIPRNESQNDRVTSALQSSVMPRGVRSASGHPPSFIEVVADMNHLPPHQHHTIGKSRTSARRLTHMNGKGRDGHATKPTTTCEAPSCSPHVSRRRRRCC